MKRIGILGGSFNPAHHGHRAISLAALEALDLDEVWWLVSPGNPLKEASGDMAPLSVRLASARVAARHAPIRVSALEVRLGTRYTVDTIVKLVRLYPKKDFIWLMGSDNLAQFDQWRGWRRIAREVPIAVIARPGYDRHAHAAPAMGWLRRSIRPARQAKRWTKWRLPALVLLRFRLDPTSATRLRAADPGWQLRFAESSGPETPGLTPTSHTS
ncbi:nicotinate-nucleotide adenylyltransferase [Sphingomonas populi]|uniref:Probable nicotinate-nucleotide adenylyltransferase n=1 Tax=Sphingomonas populi TaxID=2484750 RepID=A0A4Q6Y1Z1_9SPHN|nr:nicotinate-nucleotide adenylyltransferase [Sphingomonas populi]RZF63319.1 nicotinate-nucleotide adenylyltransferase [Sphingomonas populi]